MIDPPRLTVGTDSEHYSAGMGNSPIWQHQNLANLSKVSSLILELSKDEFSTLSAAYPHHDNLSAKHRSEQLESTSLNHISNLLLSTLPSSPPSEANVGVSEANVRVLEWLKLKGFTSLHEKLTGHSGFPWDQIKSLPSPLLMEQLVYLYLLLLHKQKEKEAVWIIGFALKLIHIAYTANPKNQKELVEETKQILGQLTYLIDHDLENTLKAIQSSKFKDAVAYIKEAFTAQMQAMCQRLHDSYTAHFATPLQSPEIAINTLIPSEIAKALLTQNGNINVGIIDLLSDIFLSHASLHINHEANLSYALKVLQQSPKLREEFGKVHAPPPYHIPSNQVIRASLGLSDEIPVTDFHAQLTILIALMSHLRQEGDVSCFAVSLAIEILSSQLLNCFKDLSHLLQEGKLTRNIKGLERDIPFLAKIYDDNLNRVIQINSEGSLILNGERYSKIWKAPAILAVARSLGITDCQKAIHQLLKKSKPLAEGQYHSLTTKHLLKKLAEQAAVFTPSSRISVSRERSDVAFWDEGIALAIAEEKNAAEDLLAGDRKLLQEVNRAEQAVSFNSKGTHEELYAKARLMFSASTCQPLLKAWENAIANMAEAGEGSMVKSNILKATLDAFKFYIGDYEKEKGKKFFPQNQFMVEFFLTIRNHLDQTIRLQYDPAAKENESQLSEEGFVLYENKNKIESQAAFIQFLQRVFKRLPDLFVNNSLKNANENLFTEALTILPKHIESNDFLIVLLARYNSVNIDNIKKIMAETPQENKMDFSSLRYTPWISQTCNRSDIVMRVYSASNVPVKMSSFISQEAKETLTHIINLCKMMSNEEKLLFKDNPNRLKSLSILGKHRFPFMAGHPSLMKAWTQGVPTPKWIEEQVIQPGLELTRVKMDRHTQDLLWNKLKTEVFPSCIPKEKIEACLEAVKQLPPDILINRYRQEVIEQCKKIRIRFDSQRLARMIDSSLCQCMPPDLRKKLENSAIHFADTNWHRNIHDIHFCFAVNPSNGELELWKVYANGSHLVALDQNYWIKNQTWEFFTLPDDLLRDDARKLVREEDLVKFSDAFFR